VELTGFVELQKKLKLIEKRELNSRKKERILAPRPTPIPKPTMVSMAWNISTGQPGLAAWLCSLPTPAHLLVS